MRIAALLLVGASLAYSQEPAPGPGKPDSRSQDSKQAKTTGGKKTKETTQPVTPVKQFTPTKDAPAAGQEGKRDKQETTVDVRSVPRLSVQPVKDWADWGYWWFGLALVIVGGFQVWLLRGTLKATLNAANAAQDSADAANRSAKTATEAAEFTEKTMRLTERADVLVDNIRLSHPGRATELIITFRNFGRSRANSVQAKCFHGIRETGVVEEMPFVSPLTLGAGAPLELHSRSLVGNLIGEASEQVFTTRQVLYRVWGKISYVDIFDKPHDAEFCAIHIPPEAFVMESNNAT